MTIRTRLVLLLVCLVAVFGATATGMRLAHRAEAERILTSLRAERSDLLDRLLALTGQSLLNFANDYSLWDEMVAFTQTGDRAWAAINIDASLPNFNAQAAWVLRPDGSLLYATGTKLPPPPHTDPDFLAALRRGPSLHFFQDTPAGLLEFRTAAILPSDDLDRSQEPRGWFIVARLWDQQHLYRLGDTLQSHVSLAPTENPAPIIAPTLIHLERALPDWHDRPARTLEVEYESPSLALLIAGNERESLLLYTFAVVVLLAGVFTLSRWVILPLRQLSQSLESGETVPIRELQRNPDEFGHLARQAAQSFLQRDALRESEERLRQWMALHERLGRDLHDGIIQTIYAAGLGLESARNQLHTDPAAAAQRLASCQRMFNDTLWQVRSFIHAIEPERPIGQSPAQSLAALVSTMQSLQPIPILADIDQTLAAKIQPKQEINLLHMTREMLSNAIRHARATQVKITLRPHPDGLARLEVTDDGAGFDPAADNPTGRGLANLAARARDLDGRLEIDSAPGKGARIAVWFRPVV